MVSLKTVAVEVESKLCRVMAEAECCCLLVTAKVK
ncbi:hypothetical protein A2U01_0066493, partial [Trifolium medium]|nr:hypothetical protein [Trifolium medium]